MINIILSLKSDMEKVTEYEIIVMLIVLQSDQLLFLIN